MFFLIMEASVSLLLVLIFPFHSLCFFYPSFHSLVFHDFHHTAFTLNYASRFDYWDRLFSTYKEPPVQYGTGVWNDEKKKKGISRSSFIISLTSSSSCEGTRERRVLIWCQYSALQNKWIVVVVLPIRFERKGFLWVLASCVRRRSYKKQLQKPNGFPEQILVSWWLGWFSESLTRITHFTEGSRREFPIFFLESFLIWFCILWFLADDIRPPESFVDPLVRLIESKLGRTQRFVAPA